MGLWFDPLTFQHHLTGSHDSDRVRDPWTGIHASIALDPLMESAEKGRAAADQVGQWLARLHLLIGNLQALMYIVDHHRLLSTYNPVIEHHYKTVGRPMKPAQLKSLIPDTWYKLQLRQAISISKKKVDVKKDERYPAPDCDVKEHTDHPLLVDADESRKDVFHQLVGLTKVLFCGFGEYTSLNCGCGSHRSHLSR